MQSAVILQELLTCSDFLIPTFLFAFTVTGLTFCVFTYLWLAANTRWGLWVHKVTLDREGFLHPLVHNHTRAPSNAHLLIALRSGRLSHLEVVFSPSLFLPTAMTKRKITGSFWAIIFVYPSAALLQVYEFISSKVLSHALSFFQHVTSWERDGEFSLIHADDLFFQHFTVTENPMTGH